MLMEFACSSLPLTGQIALSNLNDERILNALTASPLTAVQVIDKICRDTKSGEASRARTYSRSTDSQQLAEVVAKYTETKIGDFSAESEHIYSDAENACRNPVTPADTLTQALQVRDATIALNAYLNPSTPEKERRKLTAERATAIISFGGPAERTAHSHELVIANPWMLETPTKWDVHIQHGIIGSPAATCDTIKALNWPGVLHATDIRNMEIVHDPNTTVDMLIETEWMGAHIQAINRPEFTSQHAMELLYGGRGIEPHVVGRIINRYGIPVLFECQLARDERHIDLVSGGQRGSAILWLAPVVEFVEYCASPAQDSIAKVCETLGDNMHNWEMFLGLLPHWHGYMREAAEAATKL